jgi:PEGA domain
VPAHENAGNDPSDRLIAAAYAAASWARARRATWTSTPLVARRAAEPDIPAPSTPVHRVEAPSLPPPPIARPAAAPREWTLPAPLRRLLARGAIAAALVAAAVVGGRWAWDALPAMPAKPATPARTLAVEPKLSNRPAATPTGVLHVRSTPPGARVVIDGRARGVTPLDLADLRAGRHEVALESDAGSVTRSVTVSANAAATIDEAIFSGFVTVFAPFDVTVTERGRVLRADDRQQMMLPPGPHDLRIANRTLGYELVRHVDVKPGEATTIQLTPDPSTLTVTASEAAEVWLDGTRIGETPLNAAPVPLGVHEIVVRRAAGGERRLTTTIGSKPVTLNVDFAGR